MKSLPEAISKDLDGKMQEIQEEQEGTADNIQKGKDGMEPVRAGERAACNRRSAARTIILIM